MAEQPREIGRRTEYAGRSLVYQTITWRDAEDRQRTWETVERVNGRAAVMTIPWLQPSDRLLLIRQYRPPARGEVIEFPAGLVDPDEDARAAAVRELREETGFVGTITRMLPPTYNSPGLSGEAVFHAFMRIDENAPANREPTPEPDEGEFIEILPVERRDLGAFVEREMAAGAGFDSKVMAYIMGLLVQVR